MSNIYSVRMKFIFVAWIGPFLLLGAMVVATEGDIKVSFDFWTVLSLAVASICYFLLGLIAGRYERGNWKRCDTLRKLWAKLEGLSQEDTDSLLDGRNQRDVVWTYLLIFFVMWLVFASSIAFVVNFS